MRISPVRVVEEKEKLRVIHELTFGSQVIVREKRGRGIVSVLGAGRKIDERRHRLAGDFGVSVR